MRIIYCTLVLALSVMLPWWLVLPVWALYALAYPAYELIVIGVVLDAYLGTALPEHALYTLGAVALCLLMWWVKPRMVFSDSQVDSRVHS